MKKSMKKKKKSSRLRIKFKVVLATVMILYILFNIFLTCINRNITNIYIKGNNYLTDWEIIKIAKLDNYPKTLKNSKSTIENRLRRNVLIKEVRVIKKDFTKIYIEVVENRPILYNQTTKKTILLNGVEIDTFYSAPLLNEYLETSKYIELKAAMAKIDENIINKISEIKYVPDEVDSKRYLATMTDGNYVYLTIKKFNLINDYNNIVKEFNNKKGILYLNSGGYFKIMEN